MPIQNVLMNAGTWLKVGDNYLSHYGDSYMGLGYDGYWRPLIKFNNDGFSGQILSASLKVYCSSTAWPWVTGFKVNKVFNPVTAAWATPWTTAGCNAVNEDRSGVELFTGTQLTAVGWNTIPVADLSELLGVINGLDSIILTGSGAYATYIEKDPLPYLAIEYKTSIVGGIQIF